MVKIAQVYNDGVIKFLAKELIKDKYGTPTGNYTEVLKAQEWFRRTGSRAEDVYFARSLDKDINLKVAMRGNLYVDTQWKADIESKPYEVYQSDYNPKNNETIVSLMEVKK